MSAPVLRYFEWQHLRGAAMAVAIEFRELAARMDEQLPDGPEKSAGLRKLLEAKDCMVRAAMDS